MINLKRSAAMYVQAAGPSAINLELFAKGEGNVALLLGLLAQQDFYVRYYTVQLLTALAASNSFRLQQVLHGPGTPWHATSCKQLAWSCIPGRPPLCPFDTVFHSEMLACLSILLFLASNT